MQKINLGKVVPSPKGPYSKATLYDTLDIVTCDGAAYMARQSTIGNDPPYHSSNKYWLCISYGSGERGELGMSAYELAVLNGYRGNEIKWLLSLIGPQGDSGYQGDFTDFLVVNSYNNNYTNLQLLAAALSAKLGKELYERHVDVTSAEYLALLEAGACKDTTLYYIYEEDETLVTYTVNLSSNNNSYGSVYGTGSYLSGLTATLRAVPKTGYVFVKWSDNNTDATRTVVITANLTLSAIFLIESQEEANTIEFSGNLVTVENATFSGNLIELSGMLFSNNILTSSLVIDSFEFSNNLLTTGSGSFSGNLLTITNASYSNYLLENGLN